MNGLLRIAVIGRQEAPWLLGGLLVSVLAAGALLGLSVGSAGLALSPATGVAGALLLPGVVRALGLSRVLLRYAERMVTHAATFRALTALRIWLFGGLAGRSAGGLGMVRAGDALSRMVGDVEALDGLYLRIAVPAAAALLLLPVLAMTLWRADPVTALVVGGLFAIAAFILPWAAARGIRADGTVLSQAMSGLRVAALDAVEGLREVLAYGAGPAMLANLQQREAALIAVQERFARRGALCQAAASLCAQAALLAVVLGGGPAGAIAPSLFLTLAAFELVAGMPRAGVLAGHAAAAAERLVAAAQSPPAVPDPAEPLPLPAGTSLVFDRVSFRWQPDRPVVLDGLSMEVPAGSRVAVLGPSGSGKSTLAALALRVAAPQGGRVLLGGTDVMGLRAADLRSRMAWLGQDTHVFQDSVRANLLLGKPDADDAALWHALALAQLAERVRGLERGLDTWIGPGGGTRPGGGTGGTGLSGGEQRRLALARALLSDAPILILDEPAAGLDAATELDFFRMLNDAVPGRTVLLIVHRLTGVERLDRIWRITAGHAVAAAA